MARVLEIDPLAGIRRLFHWQESTEDMTLRSEQDVEPIMEVNKAKFAQVDERAKWRPDMEHVASIPLVVWQELTRLGIAQDDDALKRWMNERDNRVWRVRPGTV